ncbi:MAG: phosphatidylglycerophosphatase [Clostridiaceae bacterium BRH_c20a]|nr:MAG: phosphatidylglycerophosphatase [Clostridiaceae bacterium BRH_c20a]
MKKIVIEQLEQRGITVDDIALIVFDLQKSYYPGLEKEVCLEAIDAVLEKREVQYAVLTGLALDVLAEQDLLPEPISTIIKMDESLYGIDEILALAITNIYGTIGITSFGYLDKMKIGLIGRLDSSLGYVNTFADDIVAAIASAAAAKIAHNQKGNGKYHH